MTYPQSITWGHLGTCNLTQFLAMNPASYAGQEVFVDTGPSLAAYYSDGLTWTSMRSQGNVL